MASGEEFFTKIMRALALLLTVVCTFPIILIAPQVGVLMWSWVSFMSPQQLVSGMVLPYVYMTAIVTAIAWLLSPERKALPANLTPWIIVLFLMWMTLTSVLSLEQHLVWDAWSRNSKNLLLALAIMAIMKNRVRLHALLWVIVLSIGFYALKGGIFVLMTGGGSHVVGPVGSMISDNNNLALAMIITWPFMYYLRIHSSNKFVRFGLAVLMVMTVVATVGTYSRGGFLALSVVLGYFWWKSKRKIVIAVCGAVLVVPAVMFMPQQWVDRMNSIDKYQQDSSAMGRLDSWEMAFRIAVDRPLIGVGFEVMLSPDVIAKYYPGKSPLEAHSIWFQTMSDQGFAGLGIFAFINFLGWRNVGAVRRAARMRPDLAWARDLATMGQISLAGYLVAGSFLSMAYFDVYYAIIAMTSVLRELACRPAAISAQSSGIQERPFGAPQIAIAPHGIDRAAG